MANGARNMAFNTTLMDILGPAAGETPMGANPTPDAMTQLLARLSEPMPEQATAEPRPIGKVQSVLLSLADAAQTYARGLNPNIPPGTAQERLRQRRETQAQREAQAQNQKRRQAWDDRRTGVLAGLTQLQRQESQAQQQEQFDASQAAADERLGKQMGHETSLSEMRIAADKARDELRMSDPGQAKVAEQARGQSAGLVNMYIFGDPQANLGALKERLAGGESPEDILYEFQRRLTELPNLTKAEYDYAVADFKEAMTRFAPPPAPPVTPQAIPDLGFNTPAFTPAQGAGGSLFDILARPAALKR